MKSVKRALCALVLLSAMTACSTQSPVTPGITNSPPPSGAADREGGDQGSGDHHQGSGDNHQGGGDDHERDGRRPRDGRDDDDRKEGGHSTLTVQLSAAPGTIQKGQSATLSWTTANATGATLDKASVALNGSKIVTPDVTTTYTLVGSNASGSKTATAVVTVTTGQPPPPGKPSASLTASASAIQSGQSATLTWTSSNATAVTLNGGAVALNGSQSVSPAATTTYTLVATGAGGSASATATITVTAPPPPPPTGLTYTKDVQPILAAHCTSCHSGSSPSAGINLSTYAGVMAVATAGNASSRLVTSTQPGGSMAGFLGSTVTTLAQTIRSWVVDWAAKQ